MRIYGRLRLGTVVRRLGMLTTFLLGCATAIQAAPPSSAIDTLPSDSAVQADRAVQEVMIKTAIPSASIAIVKDGKLSYTKAYGVARIAPNILATPDTRYGIGPLSEEFIAAAILVLAEQGKLTLDDKVARWFPELTRADQISLRQLLSHMSGWRDDYPQEYVPTPMLESITPEQIMTYWAKLLLDCEPGHETRYSNTDYVIAGQIVERASKEPLMQFLEEHLFKPLGLSPVTEDDSHALSPPDAAGYTQYGLGPVRLAPQEGPGWKFSSAELAMRPRDLALWDISVMNHTLLRSQSYQAETEPVKLTDGKDSDYALGLQASKRDGQRSLYFQGEISGFLSENYIFPDDKVAVIVLTNSDAGSPPPSLEIARRLIYLFVPPTGVDKKVRDLLDQIQRRDIDRSVLSRNANAFVTDTVAADMSLSLAALGPVRALRQIGDERQQGGMSFRYYWVEFRARMLVVSVGVRPDGRIEQFLLWDIAVPMH